MDLSHLQALLKRWGPGEAPESRGTTVFLTEALPFHFASKAWQVMQGLLPSAPVDGFSARDGRAHVCCKS